MGTIVHTKDGAKPCHLKVQIIKKHTLRYMHHINSCNSYLIGNVLKLIIRYITNYKHRVRLIQRKKRLDIKVFLIVYAMLLNGLKGMKCFDYLLLLSIIDNQNGLRTSWYQTIKKYIKQIHTDHRKPKTEEDNQPRNTMIKDEPCTKVCQKGDTHKSYDTAIKKSSHILIGYLFDRIEVIRYTNKHKKKSTEYTIQHGLLEVEKWNT